MIHLQGMGDFESQPAWNLREGDVTMRNYGEKELVNWLKDVWKKSIQYTTSNWYTRRLLKTRQICIIYPYPTMEEINKVANVGNYSDCGNID
jgi:hypothetical protein